MIRLSKLTTVTDFNRVGFINEFSVSTVDLSNTCVERCKTYEPLKTNEVSTFLRNIGNRLTSDADSCSRRTKSLWCSAVRFPKRRRLAPSFQ